jgi:hypothetical protein
MGCAVVDILSEREKRSPVILLVIAVTAKVVFQSLILPLGLPVCLRVESCTQLAFDANAIA